jgi:hypothetical protein
VHGFGHVRRGEIEHDRFWCLGQGDAKACFVGEELSEARREGRGGEAKIDEAGSGDLRLFADFARIIAAFDW